MKDILDAYCGIYCGSCIIRLAYLQDRTDCIPEPWKTQCKGLDLECHGCKSDHIYPNCAKCTIRPCAKAKNIKYCFECKEYPCAKYSHFESSEEYPHFTLMLQEFHLLKEKSLKEWLTFQKKRYTCKKCGNLFAWYEKNCHFCGEKLVNVVEILKHGE